jgi:hypothetical protein
MTSLNLDTVNRLRYHLINNYAERGSPKDAINQLLGVLKFEYPTDSTVVITGTIDVKTKSPFATNQQVVYNGANFLVLTKERFLYAQNKKEELKQQQEKVEEAFRNAIADEKRSFFDSIFTEKMAKSNTLTCVFNGKQKFEYSLSQSYILRHATLYRRAEGDLLDMLGSNFLGVDIGTKDVYLLHCFYDPVKNVFDDEINFSLGIELDSIMAGKTYFFHKNRGLTRAILGYWHYGAFGRPILSKSAEGTITITGEGDGMVSGTMNLTFNFGNSTTRIYGDYNLPKVLFEDVKYFRERLELKADSIHK